MSNFLAQSGELCIKLAALWEGKRIPQVYKDPKKKAVVFVYSGENYEAYANAIEQVSREAPGLEQNN